MALSCSSQASNSNDGSPSDPLLSAVKTLDSSAIKPRVTPVIVAAAALFSLLLGMLIGARSPAVGNILWLFGTFVVIWWIVTFIHELGHLAVAWVAGFRINIFAVGPVAVVRNGRSFRLLRVSLGVFSGFVHSTPRDPDNQKGWLAAFAFGGSVANFISGGLAWYASDAFPDSSWLALWMRTFYTLSFAAGITNLFPYQRGAFASDGFGIALLLGMGSKVDQARAHRKLKSLLQRGVLPRDWDPVLLVAALGHDSDLSPNPWASYMAYLHHLDAGRDVEAAQFLEQTFSNLKPAPIFFSASIFAEAAYFFVQQGSDPALARTILKRIDGENVDDLTRLRAEASVLLAENKPYVAAQVAQRAIRLTDDWPDLGDVAIERELIGRLLASASKMTHASTLIDIDSSSEFHAVVAPAR